ncbi:histidine phosphatase family protein [Roseibium sp. AS2]|uniref:histidine phosphatase family protein n=1 Tax=Roseibium sp. AS2 TaxID=3135781 RepID=UPI003170A399
MTDRFAILVRHADYLQKPETPSALQPYALSGQGREQAREAGAELSALAADHGWQVSPEVFCSRQQRAWQTATLLAQVFSEKTGARLRVTEDAALAERSVGAFANMTVAEIEQVLAEDPRLASPPQDWKANSHYTLPVEGAESLMDAGRRVATFLRDRISSLASDPGANAQIYVGHGAAFRHAAHDLGVLGFDDIRKLSMHHARPVVLKFSPVTGWSHFGGAWKERRPLETALD